jgi:hypothetical protein
MGFKTTKKGSSKTGIRKSKDISLQAQLKKLVNDVHFLQTSISSSKKENLSVLDELPRSPSQKQFIGA